MVNETRGYVWPLVLLLLASFALTIFSYIAPDTAPAFPLSILFGSAVVTLIAGLVFYWPKLLLAADISKIEGTADDVAAARNGITVRTRMTLTAALLGMLAASPIYAQAPPEGGATKPAPTEAELRRNAAVADRDAAAAKLKQEEDQRATAALLQGSFRSEKLAGGTDNQFLVPQPVNRLTNPVITFDWVLSSNRKEKFCRQPNGAPLPEAKPIPDKTLASEQKISDSRAISASKVPDKNDPTNTVFGIYIPPPPCLWPLVQYAKISITAQLDRDNKKETVSLLEEARMPVTVLWFPVAVTIFVLALIYPGGAAASWYVSKRHYDKKRLDADPTQPFTEEEPSFWRSLDPVELTKNPWGRGSIAKLQIFTFSFIIFGLLLFYVLRTGLLANMSPDILYLMGISAVGATGAKVAFVGRRRLDMENWVWLRQKGWLPPEKDVQAHAKWSELFVDSGTKEFDPYRFQMAVFSLVVAIALITTSATGLEAFKVPPELLGLLGISHVVFIGGAAMENGGFADLNKKLSEVRTSERTYQALKHQAAAATDAQAKVDAAQKAEAERSKFKTAVAQAKEMFIAVYGDQMGDPLPPALVNGESLEPELPQSAA